MTRENEDASRLPDERGQREADALVQWLRETLPAADPADPANARFYDWWARELRARQGAGEREEGDRRAATTFAARMSARLASERAAVLTLPGRPSERRVGESDVGVTVRSAVAAAARVRAAVVVDHAVAAGVGRELWDEPAERWVELPDEVPDGQYVSLTVAGDSMLPALHDGDVLLVKLGPELTRDSFVVARRPEDGYVVKRVSAVRAREVELASLNAAYPPVRIPRDERLVVGTVVLRWCAHGGGRAASA